MRRARAGAGRRPAAVSDKCLERFRAKGMRSSPDDPAIRAAGAPLTLCLRGSTV